MSKSATEDYRTLDIRTLQRAGVLTPGWRGGWQWSRSGETWASINMETESRYSVRLRYQVTIQGQAEAKDYSVPITWTLCHLGGERPWFSCPCCNRRVAKLYSWAMFACRHCQRLNYKSQQANKRDIATDRSWKLRRALGCEVGFMSMHAAFIRKPKGMHWQTFNRKIDELKRVEDRAFGDALALIDSIERSVSRT